MLKSRPNESADFSELGDMLYRHIFQRIFSLSDPGTWKLVGRKGWEYFQGCKEKQSFPYFVSFHIQPLFPSVFFFWGKIESRERERIINKSGRSIDLKQMFSCEGNSPDAYYLVTLAQYRVRIPSYRAKHQAKFRSTRGLGVRESQFAFASATPNIRARLNFAQKSWDEGAGPFLRFLALIERDTCVNELHGSSRDDGQTSLLNPFRALLKSSLGRPSSAKVVLTHLLSKRQSK